MLDVATGTGLVLAEASKYGPRELVGVDRSSGMLAKAPQHHRLVEADARSLPFDPASFDVVFASYVLHVVDARTRAAIIGELRRVAAPRARVVTVTPRWRKDPREELHAAGLHTTGEVATRAGYPSLVLLTRPADG